MPIWRSDRTADHHIYPLLVEQQKFGLFVVNEGQLVTIQHMHRLETMEYLFQETP